MQICQCPERAQKTILVNSRLYSIAVKLQPKLPATLQFYRTTAGFVIEGNDAQLPINIPLPSLSKSKHGMSGNSFCMVMPRILTYSSGFNMLPSLI